jgi:FAD:protein FMN transferase
MIHGFRFVALGCTGRIRIANVPREHAEGMVADAVRWLRGVEARLSRFRADSVIGRLNAGESVPAESDLLAVFAAAHRAHVLTDGRYDATALPLWRLWHDPSRTAWPTALEITEAQSLVAWSSVERVGNAIRLPRSGMAVDLGGVGKEWCVDQMIDRLWSQGCTDVLVELGGDCAARGRQPDRDVWLVLLPGIAAAVTLRDEAIATSGIGTRRRMLAGRAVSHVIDARSGQPAPGMVRSASVLAADCLTAGIHASDLCLLAEVNAEAIATRCGGNPTWVRASDGMVLADPRLLARVHPIRVHDHDDSTPHSALRTPHAVALSA